ncbi:MAG TPA: hypothetical protein VIL63_11650, partial [Terriglobales bacterium]
MRHRNSQPEFVAALKNVATDPAGELGPGSKKFTHSKCGLGGWPGPHFFFQASGFRLQASGFRLQASGFRL